MIRLHGYWRSGAAYRVRIALNLKGLAYEQVTHDLRTGAQAAADYAALNPQKLVPALEIDGTVLTQSAAIMEWLEEAHPLPHLLPLDIGERAIVRAMTAVVTCDIHPLHNLRVLDALRATTGHQDTAAGEAAVAQWTARWITDGFVALEAMVARYGGVFAFGDTPTIADCVIVPQVYSAERFKVPIDAYPRLAAAAAAARALPVVAAAHPKVQPDAPPRRPEDVQRPEDSQR